MPDSGPLTQSQALELLRRTSDEGWISSELSGPDGTAVINARTAIAAATSQALQDQADRCTISDAPGGTPGVCTLTVSRNLGTGTIYIPQGYTFVTDEGIVLALSQPITIPAGPDPQTFDLPLRTLRQTELVNGYDPAFDSLLTPGDLMATASDAPLILDSGTNAVLGPGATDDDHALRYAFSTAIAQADSDWLSAHGDERGQRRQQNEETEEYRARIRLIPDAVSPKALAAAVHSAASNAGLPDVYLLETVNPLARPAAMAANTMALEDSPFADDYCDDPIGEDRPEKLPWRALEQLSIREGRAYFRLSLSGQLVEPDGSILYLDDGYCDDELWGYPDSGISGLHPRLLGALMTVPNAAMRIKAGGVLEDFYVENHLVVPPAGVELGSAAAVGPTVVWTLLSDPLAIPGSETRAWLYRDGLLSRTCSTAGLGAHSVTFTFSDATTFTTSPASGYVSQHMRYTVLAALGFPFKPIVKIQGRVHSDGVHSVQLAGTFWVTPYVL